MAEGLSVNSLCSSDNGTWTRPGGHGGKRSFSCRWPDGCTSRKTSGSFPRWLYLPSLAAFPNRCHLWGEPWGEGVSLLSPEGSSFSELVSGYRAHSLDIRALDW